MSCPDCFKGSNHASTHGEPKGTTQDLYGYRTYITGAKPTQDQDSSPSQSQSPSTIQSQSTIIYLPDVFSHKLINGKLLADRYAEGTGCRVLFPDVVPGGGVDAIALSHADNLLRPGGWFNPFRWFGRLGSLTAALYHMVPALITSGAPKSYPQILQFVRDVRADMPPKAKLGVAGFCWGGHAATFLCLEETSEEENGKKKPLIDASFTAHPSFVNAQNIADAITTLKIPYSCAVAEKDFATSPKVTAQAEDIIKSRQGHEDGNGSGDGGVSQNEYKYEFVVHRGCGHGFAVRANPHQELEKKGMDDAAVQAIEWFKRFL